MRWPRQWSGVAPGLLLRSSRGGRDCLTLVAVHPTRSGSTGKGPIATSPYPERPDRPESTGAADGADVMDMTDVTDQDRVVDALLAASRALVAIAARSLADEGVEVTLPQFRALVVLASRGPQRVVDVSGELGIDPSTGTRLCDRLARKGLVRRQRSTTDRRVVRVTLTPDGRALVDRVTASRRRELSRIVTSMPGRWPAGVVEALMEFAAVTGETPEDQWWMGWRSGDSTDG